MRKIVVILVVFVIALLGVGTILAVSDYEARHRLPPVIYSLELPQYVKPGSLYDFRWTVMGYHDTYDVIVEFYESSGDRFDSAKVSPYSTTQGEYQWDGIWSTRFFYEVPQKKLCFTSKDYIKVRFYASPINDPINNDFLSVLIPGGLGYTADGTSGRAIRLEALDPGPAPRAGPRCP